ncbi:hypothetical protein H9K57_08340 [Vibrio parahaemolyticus]|uniref:hypothetical protein n=1 Tax=Vibrio parahaemolyticus TaxID=670 RepID=UPI00205D398C|nr:hypothetical protein [Vibrio parahaemolyticus]UPR37609.1 hypothetical protein H9K57_08340 [Vibrio parahaemolyticus]
MKILSCQIQNLRILHLTHSLPVTNTKFFYSAAQIDMYADSVFAETFLRLSEYIEKVNLKIANPTTVPNAVIRGFWDEFGIRANIKPMTEEDRGKLHIALDYTTNPDLVVGADLEYEIGSWLEKNSRSCGCRNNWGCRANYRY